MKIKICDVCGRPFEARGNSKRCSRKCERIAHERLMKESNRKRNRDRQAYMKENSRRKIEKGEARRRSDGNKSLVIKNAEARALGMSYGKYIAREAAAAVKVDINIGSGDGEAGDRKGS